MYTCQNKRHRLFKAYYILSVYILGLQADLNPQKPWSIRTLAYICFPITKAKQLKFILTKFKSKFHLTCEYFPGPLIQVVFFFCICTFMPLAFLYLNQNICSMYRVKAMIFLLYHGKLKYGSTMANICFKWKLQVQIKTLDEQIFYY